MTHIIEYVQDTFSLAKRFDKRMPDHQRHTYAAEAVVERALPLTRESVEDIEHFIVAMCIEEDLDIPSIETSAIEGFDAAASRKRYRIIFTGPATRMTACHELAHCVVDEDGHGPAWRALYVHLVRKHVSIEHAALLHALFNRVDLPVDWKERNQSWNDK